MVSTYHIDTQSLQKFFPQHPSALFLGRCNIINEPLVVKILHFLDRYPAGVNRTPNHLFKIA